MMLCASVTPTGGRDPKHAKCTERKGRALFPSPARGRFPHPPPPPYSPPSPRDQKTNTRCTSQLQDLRSDAVTPGEQGRV